MGRSTDTTEIEEVALAEAERRYQAYLAFKEVAVSAEDAFSLLRAEDESAIFGR